MNQPDDRPWMTALEMQFSALAVVRKITTMPGVPSSVTDRHVLRYLANSSPFYWNAETVSAVWLASKSIPDDACFARDMLPDGLSSAWWWLGWPIPLPMKNPKSNTDSDFADIDRGHISAILLSVHPDGTWTISCGRMSIGTLVVPWMIEVNTIREGLSLRDLSTQGAMSFNAATGKEEIIKSRDVALFRFILAASVWLKQRIVVSGSGHIERHRRKQLAREHDAVLSDVKVIQLRRPQIENHQQSEDGAEVEWSCRWIVSGHWRNQYHPSTGKHELKYILPYVKGPEDKPLKVPTHTVYEVSR